MRIPVSSVLILINGKMSPLLRASSLSRRAGSELLQYSGNKKDREKSTKATGGFFPSNLVLPYLILRILNRAVSWHHTCLAIAAGLDLYMV